MIKFGGTGKWLSDKPVVKELKNLCIDELVKICKMRRSIKYSFKKNLINYIVKIGY